MMLLKLITVKINRIYFFRRTLWNISVKQFKAKYAGSVLGIFWVVINPILMMLAITFVFTAVFKTGIKDFALFVLSGILPWMFFSGALSEATPSLSTQKSVLHQFSLPKEIIPLSIALSYLMNFLMSGVIVYPVFLFQNPGIITLAVLLPAILILTYIFTSGIVLLFSVVNVIFRDLEHLVGTLLMFWFWVTPIFYPIEMIPGNLRWVFNLNPLSVFILFYRDIIFYCRMPDPATFLGVVIWAFSSLSVGILVSIWFESSVLKRI
ncbi:MAG: ABC transporter permease [Candidatus Omnitrophica bacterium]|nr:ABC transporter permease [Candidatus Omnitrophota bacterium]MBU1924071.1 ABC transporter permease [Candidatus Omnitrophota bacterium]